MVRGEPRVTVGIPLYRGQEHILEAVASVRADRLNDWEILIFDDCSPDSSVALIESLRDSRIRIIRSSENVGLVHARNKLLQEAQAPYVAWLDQDDYNYPHRLETQANFLDSHPTISLVASWTDVLVEAGSGARMTFTKVQPSSHRSIRAFMPFTNPIACNTVMMRKADFQRHKLRFREQFGNTLDYDLWSRSSHDLTFHVLKKPLSVYRVHPKQTSRGTELLAMNKAALRVQEEYINHTLNLVMSDEQIEIHATLPQLFTQRLDRSSLREIMYWLTELRQANSQAGKLNQHAFHDALAQQWYRAVASAYPMGVPEKIWRALEGARNMSISWPAIVQAAAESAHRRWRRH